MGEELAGYGLVVDVDVRMNNSLVFSSDFADGRETTTLAIDGRVFGANQPVSPELVLAIDGDGDASQGDVSSGPKSWSCGYATVLRLHQRRQVADRGDARQEAVGSAAGGD